MLVAACCACGRIGFDANGLDAPARSYAETVLEDAPLAYYRLDEAGGGIAADSSGHGNDGRLLTTGGTIVFGQSGALTDGTSLAAHFTGQGQAGDLSSAELQPPMTVFPWIGDFTIEGWLRPGLPPGGWRSLFFVAEDWM